MKHLIILGLLFSSHLLIAQRDLTPSKKRDAFGTRDFRNLSHTGLQIQLGPTYMFTKKQGVDSLNPMETGYRGNYSFDPDGKVGFYGELGLFHFPKKDNLFSLLVTYWDWGLGMKYFRGSEGIHLDRTDALGNVVSEDDNVYKFGHGNVYGRISLHRHFMMVKNWFLVTSLGLNFDYRLITAGDNDYNWDPMTDESSFYKPFYAQMHAGLGFCYRLKRGSYLTLGARTPVLGYESFTPNIDGSGQKESRFGNPAFNWYSSKYWPVLFQVKYMFLFEKRQKGCKGAEIRDEDAERYRNGH